jgi:putative phosphoesterase
MTTIGLISDTHSYLHPDVAFHLQHCDEIWHAGDFGQIKWINDLKEKLKELNKQPVIRGVYGNIDGKDIRSVFPERLIFNCEEVNVMMQHIGGYPGKYAPGIRGLIVQHKIQLFISGHSHILKVIYDDALNCLHMNPGAAGQQGWHKVKTLLRFVIDGKEIKNCEVVEL